jgi:hypothetical protein
VLRPEGTWRLTCACVVVELRGFEPLTPCMPLMLGYLTSLCATSPTHATEPVKGAAEGWIVRRREVTCSAVSGKSLARASAWSSFANAGRTVSAALTTCDWAPPVHCCPRTITGRA